MWWGFWKDYPKVQRDGREYAQIGTRLYTQHGVERFLPSGRRTVGDVPVARGEGGGHMFYEKARSIPPRFVEEAIQRGQKQFVIRDRELRTVHVLGRLRKKAKPACWRTRLRIPSAYYQHVTATAKERKRGRFFPQPASLRDLEVVTTRDEEIVITISYRH